MRNKNFIAEHRGGPLNKKNHYLLALWAADCAEHVLSTFTDISSDNRPQKAIELARAWASGKISVGDARNAAFAAHAAAREIQNSGKAASTAARAAGHAVATAHMADHSLQAANYALKTIELLNMSAEDEINWQNETLPKDIKNLILEAREKNAKN